MIMRVDRLQVELPMPSEPDPAAAAAVQELRGGRFGEMSTLMNYTHQSFNMRWAQEGQAVLRPGREHRRRGVRAHRARLGRDQWAAQRRRGRGRASRLKRLKDGAGLHHHWINSGLGALPVNSLGQGWNGEYVFNSGDLVLDLLHKYFLENGARMAKIRVHETTDHPIARHRLCSKRTDRGP